MGKLEMILVPSHALGSSTGHGAKLLYGVLWTMMALNDSNALEVPRKTLCKPLGVTERTLERYLLQLRSAGLVEVTVQGGGHSNLYRLPRMEETVN